MPAPSQSERINAAARRTSDRQSDAARARFVRETTASAYGHMCRVEIGRLHPTMGIPMGVHSAPPLWGLGYRQEAPEEPRRVRVRVGIIFVSRNIELQRMRR